MKKRGAGGGGHGAAAGASAGRRGGDGDGGGGEGEGKLRIHLKRSCTDRKVVPGNTKLGLTTDGEIIHTACTFIQVYSRQKHWYLIRSPFFREKVTQLRTAVSSRL